MKVCVLYSGGKDSNLALLKANEHFSISCLVTVSPKSEESILFHYPNVQLVKLQAEALNLPIVMKYCEDDEESSIEALYNALEIAKEKYEVQGVVTGAIRSTYQATRFQRICDDLELWCFNPLWLKDEISLLNEAIKLKFEIIITRIAGYPLKKDLLGRKITNNLIEYFKNIRQFLNPSGEGGEYETFVLDMPMFSKKIKILDWDVIGEDYDATLIIRKAELIEK